MKGPMSLFVGVVYQTQWQISEDSNKKSYDNGKRTRAIQKPYIRTEDKILSRTKDLLGNEVSAKNVYDCINKES